MGGGSRARGEGRVVMAFGSKVDLPFFVVLKVKRTNEAIILSKVRSLNWVLWSKFHVFRDLEFFFHHGG